MNWEEFTAARQMLADETLGRVVREVERREDEEFDRSYRMAGR